MDDRKRKSLDEYSDESERFESQFERLFGGEGEESARVRLVAEITNWLQDIAKQGRFIPLGSADRRAFRSLLEGWSSRLRRQGRSVEDIGSLADFDPNAGIVLTGDCPYPGLDPYTEPRRHSFFGREALVSGSVAYLEQQGNQILLIVGASGSGKSSLALAGILPRLMDAYNGAWLFGPRLTPGAHPLAELASSVAAAIGHPDQTSEVAGRLAAKPSEALHQLTELCQDKPLVLFIDQFEELFTLCRDTGEQSAFAQVLVALSDPTPPDGDFCCRILLTLRTDHLQRFEADNTLKGLIGQNNTHQMSTMGFGDIKRAIQEPAEKVGLRFVPATLIDRLASQTGGLANGLPLLQFALRRLWDTRPKNKSGEPLDLITEKMVNDLPDVERALGNVAEEVFKTLSSSQQQICERLLLELVVLDENFEEPLRRRRNEAELRRVLEARFSKPENLDRVKKDVDKVIGDFVAAGLLRRFGEEPDCQLEVAHEALLRHWGHIYGLLSGAVVKERLHLVKQIGREARDWVASGGTDDYLKLRGEQLHRANACAEDGWLAEGELIPYIEACKRREAEERLKEQRAQRAEQQAEIAASVQRANKKLWFSLGIAIFAFVLVFILGGKVAYKNKELETKKNELVTKNDELDTTNKELDTTNKKLDTTNKELDTKNKELDTKNREIEDSRNSAVASAEEAKKQTKLASSRALATAAINQSFIDPELGVLLALHAVDTAKPLGGDAMREAVDALGGTINPARVRLTKKLDGPINKAALSPDQKRLVVQLGNGDLQVLKWPEGREEMQLQSGDAKFWNPKFAPTGKLIGAIASDKTVCIWNAETGVLQYKLTPPDTGTPVALDFSADGSVIAIGGSYTAWVWRLGDKNPFLTLAGHKDARGIGYTVTAVAFHPHPDKQILATAAYDMTIRLWNLQSGKQVALLQGHGGYIAELEFSPDGQELLSASQDNTARIWDFANERERVKLYGHPNSVFSASYSRDGKKIVTGSADATARIWDAESGREIVLLSSHTKPVVWVRFASDDRQVISASWDGTVKTWSASGHIGRTDAVWFSPDGSVVATSGDDRTIRLWDAASGDELRVLTKHQKAVTSLRFSGDGTRLASGDASGQIEVWDPSTGKNVASLCCHSDGIESIAFSPDGSRLVSAAGSDGVALWNVDRQVLDVRLPFKPGFASEKVAFSPDGQWIAAHANDGTVSIWKATDPTQVSQWRAHTSRLHVLAFSPDSKMLMTGAEDHLVKLWWNWDVAPGKIRHEMHGHEEVVMNGVFTPDGSRVITSDLSGAIIVWDTDAGGRLEGPPRAHKAMSFLDLSRDGTRLASFSWDRTAKVWDTKSWRELATLTHRGQVNQGAISPDGMRIATATLSDGVRIVPLDPAEVIRLAKTRVTRALRPDECLQYLQRKDCPPLPR